MVDETDHAVDFIRRLKKLPGARNCDGEASSQVYFELACGQTIRIGVTDPDVTDTPGLWVDGWQTGTRRK